MQEVVTDWATGAHNVEVIRRILRKTSLAMYMATEGRYFVDDWAIRVNGYSDYSCFWGDIVFPRHRLDASMAYGGGDNPGETCWDGGGDCIKMNTCNWCYAGQGNCCVFNVYPPPPADQCACSQDEVHIERIASRLLHEMSHFHPFFRLRDEYNDTENCGHSIMMGSQQGYNANCVDYCVYGNGGFDHEPLTTPHSQNENNWNCLLSKLVVPVLPGDNTPDSLYSGLGDADLGPAVSVTVYYP
jgi:hypothetical protein